MNLELKDKIVLVTGASSGIGAAAAVLFANEGAKVLIGYRDHPEAAHAICSTICSGGGVAGTVRLDLADIDHMRNTVNELARAWGPLDAVVFNAGANRLTPMDEIDEAEWDEIMTVNLKGHFFLLQAVAPHIRETGAAVFVSSIAGQMGAPAHAHYAAAKAGLINLAKSAAKRYAEKIRVNCVAPGVALTPMGRDAIKGASADYAQTKLLSRRFATPEEVARVIVFLASPAASYIYGATIDVNGGRDLR